MRFCWLYGNRAKPYVIRAGNLLCQEWQISSLDYLLHCIANKPCRDVRWQWCGNICHVQDYLSKTPEMKRSQLSTGSHFRNKSCVTAILLCLHSAIVAPLIEVALLVSESFGCSVFDWWNKWQWWKKLAEASRGFWACFGPAMLFAHCAGPKDLALQCQQLSSGMNYKTKTLETRRHISRKPKVKC